MTNASWWNAKDVVVAGTQGLWWLRGPVLEWDETGVTVQDRERGHEMFVPWHIVKYVKLREDDDEWVYEYAERAEQRRLFTTEMTWSLS